MYSVSLNTDKQVPYREHCSGDKLRSSSDDPLVSQDKNALVNQTSGSSSNPCPREHKHTGFNPVVPNCAPRLVYSSVVTHSNMFTDLTISHRGPSKPSMC